MAARLQLNSSRNQTNESGSSCATRPHFENRSTRRIRMPPAASACSKCYLTHFISTLLKVQMKGKALFFKTIGVQQNYSRSDFRQVPDDLTRFAKSACAAIDNRPGRCQAGCRCTVAASCQMRCLLNEVVLSHLRSLEMSSLRERF